MSQAYQMVMVSLVSCAVLCSALVAYVYYFPKKKLSALVVLLMFSILPLISIFRPGVYQSGDFTLHTTWNTAFSRALAEGILFPQWAGDLAGGLGYPAFIFQYQIPYYLASLYHLLGFNYITSTKLFYATAYLLSALTMYRWAKSEFDTKSALIATILYQFSPVYFIQLHFYSSFGSSLAFAMLPLSFWGIKKLFETLRYRWFVITSIGFALTILTHQTVGLTSLPILGVYLLISARRFNRSSKQVLFGAMALVFGGLLATYYWLPMLTLTQYINQATNHLVEFSSLKDFFFSPWKFGLLFQGSMGEISWTVGYAQWLVVAISAYVLIKQRVKKTDRLLLSFFFMSYWLLFILIQKPFAPLWQLPLLNNFRFTSRLLIFNVFFVSGMVATCGKYVKPRLIEHIFKLFRYKPQGKQKIFFKQVINNQLGIMLIGLVLSTTILNWGNRIMLPTIDDQDLMKNEVVYYTDGSLLPIWYTRPLQEQSRVDRVYTEPATIITGEGTISQLSRSTTRHVYAVEAKTPVIIRESTLYFPGWQVRANDQLLAVTYQEPNDPGLIHYELPEGTWNVEITFSSSPAKQLGYWISGGTLLALVGLGMVGRLKE